MLLSMTGQGQAQSTADRVTVSAEVRTINGRYFKLSLRGADGLAGIEQKVENAVRKVVRRGSVQVNLRVSKQASAEDFVLNTAVLSNYRKQLVQLYDQLHVSEGIHLESLLSLPGVVQEAAAEADDAAGIWPVVKQALSEALDGLDAMRKSEGQAMADDLQANCEAIAAELSQIETRAPLVVDYYRQRLQEKMTKFLASYETVVEPADIAREVALFSERCDISEETVRLRSHLDQFAEVMNAKESNGRKLDFITQEMSRETNTIGSKANDAEIGRRVIEIKASLERIREMIQNVE